MMNPNGPHTGRPSTRAERGMVSTPHSLASQTGVNILRHGGSAVDAAIAANAVLCVAYPHMAGIGGDAFFLIRPEGGDVEAINASGPAAKSISIDYYADHGITDAIPQTGVHSAITVPGAVDGWRLAHERYGKLDWNRLFLDAIHYARNGVAVARSLAQWYPENVALLNETEATAAVFLPDGRALREGEILRNRDLASSLELLVDQGARDGFYEGPLAERICDGVEGLKLTPEDFAQYHASWEQPIHTDYRGYSVYEMPPNTQGFVALQALNILEGYDVAGWGDMNVEYVHHAAEAIKLAFADRDGWLTDPEFHDIPVERLINKGYAAERRDMIRRESSMNVADVPSGIHGAWAGKRQAVSDDTIYMAAVDDDGLMVSLIESIYHDFGSGVVSDGTGVLLQNRGSFFSLDEEHHNRLEPGKRTFHTLIPAIATNEDGSTYAALGAMGGEGQPQSQVAMLTRMIDFGYDVQQAIEAPRWLMGRTWGAESQDLWLEGRFPDPVVHELERRGQPVKMLEDWNDNVGHAQAIRVNKTGFYEGGADPRGDGAAIGY